MTNKVDKIISDKEKAMEVPSVTRNHAMFKMSVDELYRISECLDAVISQYLVMDKEIVVYPKEVYQEVHEKFIELVLSITDSKGNLIPSN
jgi:hypothetical protein